VSHEIETAIQVNKISFDQEYKRFLKARPGDKAGSWLGKTRITGISQDPISLLLLVTFKGPFRIEKIIKSGIQFSDSSVLYARLDLDSNNKPVSLEILPKS
jgi:hypothetical protein